MSNTTNTSPIMAFSKCLITLNEYNQFILNSADLSFLENLGLSFQSIGLPINRIFPSEFTHHINSIYRTYLCSGTSLSQSRLTLKLSYPTTKNLDIYINYNDTLPEFSCNCFDVLEESYYENNDNSFIHCTICNNNISYSSPGFTEFINKYNLPVEYFTRNSAITNSIKSKVTERKLISLCDNSGSYHTYMITVLPSVRTSYPAFTLYINEIISPNKLSDLHTLTFREYEVAKLVSKGLTNRSIACELCISEGCVKKYLSNIFVKLHIHSRMDIYGLF